MFGILQEIEPGQVLAIDHLCRTSFKASSIAWLCSMKDNAAALSIF